MEKKIISLDEEDNACLFIFFMYIFVELQREIDIVYL
jgi:hypothetical protein